MHVHKKYWQLSFFSHPAPPPLRVRARVRARARAREGFQELRSEGGKEGVMEGGADEQYAVKQMGALGWQGREALQ